MEVEEDDWLPPPAGDSDGEEMELSGEVLGLRFEEPFEQMVQVLVKAQALEKRTARQRFPALPQWMFTGDGQLMGAVPEWSHMEGVWSVRLGSRMLTKLHRAAYV
ncbi:unnamed protein product [Prorocentrum cordatum]|uniref:Uncharacterized protein n=1 Tax=Prorocentrum cordatum TaxID=2364126 RepID=A0ABN9VWT5_9DINO|nr:unnamed protein product [Polarella glacialis]